MYVWEPPPPLHDFSCFVHLNLRFIRVDVNLTLQIPHGDMMVSTFKSVKMGVLFAVVYRYACFNMTACVYYIFSLFGTEALILF